MKKILTAFIAISLLFGIGLLKPAQAATITVDTNLDSFGIPGTCSLRAAIETTNNAAQQDGCVPAGPFSPLDTIVLPSLPAGQVYELTIPGSGENNNQTGDLDISDPVDIQGGGAANTIIEARFPANDPDRVLHNNTSTFSILVQPITNISGVTIQDGLVDDNSLSQFVGGGIYNDYSELTLQDCVVQNNSVVSTFQGIDTFGGGIFSEGVLTIQRCDVNDNDVSAAGSQLSALSRGGGIHGELADAPANAITIEFSNIFNNVANNGAGGGVSDNRIEDLLIFSSAIFDNRVIGEDQAAAAANPFLGNGGGIHAYFVNFNLINSTVSGNEAVGSGGGAYILDDTSTASYFISSSTITDNTANSDSSGIGDGGGLTTNLPTQILDLLNTIIGVNIATGATNTDCLTLLTAINSLGYNLIQNLSAGCTIGGNTTGNVTGQDPLLDILQDNGGRTPTHALLSNSPALDAGRPEGSGGCVDEGLNPLQFDQRGTGFPRVAVGTIGGTPRCDIGAYEARTPDTQVEKVADQQEVSIGDNVTYTITVTNNGPGTATGVTMTDNLPAELSFVSATPSQGTCTNNVNLVTCDLGSLLEGSTATVIMVATVVAEGTITNTTIITHNEPDPDPSNNSSSATVQAGLRFLQGSGPPCSLNNRSPLAPGARNVLLIMGLTLGTLALRRWRLSSKTK